jgi:formate transporter
MTDQVPAPQPAIFNFNAYNPAEIEEAIEKVGVWKANQAFLRCLMLGVVAGARIGLGALYFGIVASDATLSFAATRVPSSKL